MRRRGTEELPDQGSVRMDHDRCDGWRRRPHARSTARTDTESLQVWFENAYRSVSAL